MFNNYDERRVVAGKEYLVRAHFISGKLLIGDLTSNKYIYEGSLETYTNFNGNIDDFILEVLK